MIKISMKAERVSCWACCSVDRDWDSRICRDVSERMLAVALSVPWISRIHWSWIRFDSWRKIKDQLEISYGGRVTSFVTVGECTAESLSCIKSSVWKSVHNVRSVRIYWSDRDDVEWCAYDEKDTYRSEKLEESSVFSDKREVFHVRVTSTSVGHDRVFESWRRISNRRIPCPTICARSLSREILLSPRGKFSELICVSFRKIRDLAGRFWVRQDMQDNRYTLTIDIRMRSMEALWSEVFEKHQQSNRMGLTSYVEMKEESQIYYEYANQFMFVTRSRNSRRL